MMRPLRSPSRTSCLLALLAVGCSPAPEEASGVELAGYAPAQAGLLRAAGWRTNFERTTVPLDAIRTCGLSREVFVPIAAPRHAAAADVGLDPAEPVLVHRGQDRVRAWPLAHLLRRELALDEVDGVPVAVTLCSLCASARVWDRRLDGRVLDLAVSGMLLDGNALLYDRGTESLWRQLDGEAVAGTHAGRRLRALATFTVSFGALRAAHPDALVMLAPDSGRDPPLTLISAAEVARGVPPSWMATTCADPLALVLRLDSGVSLPVAGPGARTLADAVVLRDPTTAAPHRAPDGALGPAVGSAAAFRRELDGRALTFESGLQGVRDRETGSRWNELGEAIEGPLAGKRLGLLPQVQAFRFAF